MKQKFPHFTVTRLSCLGSRGLRSIMSVSATSYANAMAGKMSVPRSMKRIVTVPNISGMPMTMYRRNGISSGMLLAKVYAMDFFRLSNIRRPQSEQQ